MKMTNYTARSIALILGTLSSTSSYASESYLDDGKHSSSIRLDQHKVPLDQEGTTPAVDITSNPQAQPTKGSAPALGDILVSKDRPSFNPASGNRNELLAKPTAGKQAKAGKGRLSRPTRDVTFQANNYRGLVVVNPQMLPMIPGGWRIR